MKRFFFSTTFALGMAAAAVMGLLFVPTASPQGARPESSDDGSLVVVARSVLSHRSGQTFATTNTSITTLRSPRSALPRTFARSTANTAQRYFITDLGTPGGTQSFAYAINDSGQVAGSSLTTQNTSSHSFLYSDGQMTDLYPFNSQSVTTVGPTGINKAGQLASGLVINGVYVPAILNSATGDLTVIRSLGGVTSYGFNGVATSINTFGKAVGYSYIDSITRHAFLYSNGVMTDIDSFGGYSAALAINDAGVIAGFASDQYNGVAHAFVYTNGVMTDIVPDTESYARDINNRNQVVGDFLTANHSAFHPFIYSTGTFTDLAFAGIPFSINDQGQIVGITSIANKQHAFVYTNGTLVDLNSVIQPHSGWELSWAFDINGPGQIAGYGSINNTFRAFLLTPVVSRKQCHKGDWKTFGFQNQGQCIQFVNTRK